MSNIVLIGMPGSGKSTVGVVLAKILGFHFVDSDLLLQEKTGKLLHELIAEKGSEGFWRAEEEANLSIEGKCRVISTGGSAIYGERAMTHFRETGMVIYLKLGLDSLTVRLGDLHKRGVTLREGQTLADLYAERTPYYEKYADVTIDCEDKPIRLIALEIAEKYRQSCHR